MSIINYAPRSATATSLAETLVFKLPIAHFYDTLEQSPRLAIHFIKHLSKRFQGLDKELKKVLGENEYLQYRVSSISRHG